MNRAFLALAALLVAGCTGCSSERCVVSSECGEGFFCSSYYERCIPIPSNGRDAQLQPEDGWSTDPDAADAGADAPDAHELPDAASCTDTEIERRASIAELNERTPGACVLEAERARSCCCTSAALDLCVEQRCYDQPGTEGC